MMAPRGRCILLLTLPYPHIHQLHVQKHLLKLYYLTSGFILSIKWPNYSTEHQKLWTFLVWQYLSCNVVSLHKNKFHNQRLHLFFRHVFSVTLSHETSERSPSVDFMSDFFLKI
jgi:hypothetical protein